MLKPLQILACAVTALAAAVAAPAATAAGPAGAYAQFQYCPYTDTAVKSCVIATTNSGSFTIGSTVLQITDPIVLQGGVSSVYLHSDLYDAVGAPTLQAAPGLVPGGLLGITNPAPNWPFPLWVAFWNIVNSVNDVTATIEYTGGAWTYLSQALVPPIDGSDATVFHLPARVKLGNPFLGDTCYIGSPSNPIMLNLVANTTSPPPPNQPISGTKGTLAPEKTTNPTGVILHINDGTIVDNSFAVPGAGGCGNIAFGLPIVTQLLDALVSGAVNLKVGLPSAGGKNTAIMQSDATIAATSFVKASVQ